MVTDTANGVLAKPAEFLEDVLTTVREGEPDHDSVGELRELIENLENLYKKAVKEQHIGFFFTQLPNFEELKTALNYFLATNPNSKVNVGGYIKQGDLKKASMFLEKYMLRASQEPSKISQAMLQSVFYLGKVREFMTSNGYDEFVKQLEKPRPRQHGTKKTKGGIIVPAGIDAPEEGPNPNLEEAVQAAENYMRGVLFLAGGEGFEGLDDDITGIVGVRKKDDVEYTINSLIAEEKHMDALSTAVRYMKSAEFAYGDLPQKAGIYAKFAELMGYEEKINAAIDKAKEMSCALKEETEKANGKEAKTKVDEALEGKKKIEAEFGRKIVEFKRMIDGYENEGNYKAKLRDIVDRVRKNFGYAQYSKALAASEAEVNGLLKSRGYVKRAEKVIDLVRRTWAYFNGTLNQEDIDMGIINYDYLAVLSQRDHYRQVLRERVKNARLARTGATEEDEGLKAEAKKLIDALVHLSKRTPDVYVNAKVFQMADQVLANAPDIERQREMAYLAAEHTMPLFGKVFSAAWNNLKSGYFDNGNSAKEWNDSIDAAIMVNKKEILEYQLPEAGSNASPFAAYKTMFPYAEGFFPLESFRNGEKQSLDLAACLRVDTAEIERKRKAGEPQKTGLLDYFYSLFKKE